MFKLLIVCVLLPSILTISCGTGTRAVFNTDGSTEKCVSNTLLTINYCTTYQEDAANLGTYLCKACQTNHLLILFSHQTMGILTTNLGNNCFLGSTINNCIAYSASYNVLCYYC